MVSTSTRIARRLISASMPILVISLYGGSAFAGHLAPRPGVFGQSGSDGIVRPVTSGQSGSDGIVRPVTSGQSGSDGIVRPVTSGQSGSDGIVRPVAAAPVPGFAGWRAIPQIQQDQLMIAPESERQKVTDLP